MSLVNIITAPDPATRDTPIESAYFAAGGILPYMLQQLLSPASDRTGSCYVETA